ncbi:MAG: class I tRNA ligase family protein [Candidatus Paceibacterota bacterium]|jgi:isoleucyl-tRNA synthetase
MAENTNNPQEPKIKSKLVELEAKTLAFWNERQIFKKTLARKGKDFVFYDGPPFATGLPHFGHLLPTTIKDIIPRYKTMQGYRVKRRWGWDCHGLPVENLIEKELGLKSKKDILDYGIGKFNAAAEASVLRYAKEWREIIPRIGRWVDMEEDYRTMDCGYTESVWWAFKTLHDKGLVYEGFKSMQICPRCETTLSNFEVNQGYKDITDISVFVRLELVGEENTHLLAWTTTPWTLPGNVALAVGSEIDYARVSHDGATYIIARDRVADVFAGKEHSLMSVEKGSALVGKEYKPLFSYFDNGGLKNRANGFKIYAAEFVTTADGTGIVHIAPAFGDDDLKLGQKHDLPFIQHVGMNGVFVPEVLDFRGLEVKPKGDHQSTDIEVIKWLAHKGFLFEKKKIIHSYPHCWRCDTPLLNYATSSWFVRVTDFKDKLVAANKKVSWTPSDIRDGRFGKWLEGARDWAISRSRFWGAPIPVWRGIKSGKIYPVGSIGDLKSLIRKSGNSYTLLRHGESESNVLGILNSEFPNKYHLTKKGREQISERAKALAAQGVDVIVASDFLRTKESARIVAEACGMDAKDIVYDVRLREYSVGPNLEGQAWESIEAAVRKHGLQAGMETPAELKRRVLDAMYDIDRKYFGKKILVISHGAPLNTILHGVQEVPGTDKVSHSERKSFQTPAEMHSLDFVALPHNERFDLDLHRPFIDKVECVAPDGEELVRVSEVFDCWFESGSMPFAQFHYTGSALPHFNPRGGLFRKALGFPADFIAEGVDQTRGWFYTLTVLGVALFGRSPFKNVIVNGIVLAEDGQKMAKSKGNFPPLLDTVDKYGADSLRYFFASSPAVKAEDTRFSEKGVDEVSKKLLQRLDNVLSFFELYGDAKTPMVPDSAHVLDSWIRARLAEVRDEVTAALDACQIDRAARPLMGFVDDLSTWYIRRSRDRFKSDNAVDQALALGTTKYVLREFAKISAPFIPFYAEYLFGRVRVDANEESVHLELWPRCVTKKESQKLIDDMSEIRRLVTIGLEQRAKAGIKVRQPLASLSIKKDQFCTDLLDLVKDEVNVKEVLLDTSLDQEVVLDVVVTDVLKKEGVARDVIRAVQDLRKKEGLTVGDKVSLLLDSDEKGKELVHAFLGDIKRVTLVTGIEYATLPHVEPLAIEGYSFRLGIRK